MLLGPRFQLPSTIRHDDVRLLTSSDTVGFLVSSGSLDIRFALSLPVRTNFYMAHGNRPDSDFVAQGAAGKPKGPYKCKRNRLDWGGGQIFPSFAMKMGIFEMHRFLIRLGGVEIFPPLWHEKGDRRIPSPPQAGA